MYLLKLLHSALYPGAMSAGFRRKIIQVAAALRQLSRNGVAIRPFSGQKGSRKRSFPAAFDRIINCLTGLCYCLIVMRPGLMALLTGFSDRR